MTTRGGRFFSTQEIMPAVEPTKSASASTSGGHSGCAMTRTPGMVGAIAAQLLAREALVHHAAAFPEDHLDAGLRSDPAPEVLVGQEDDACRAPSDSTTATALPDVQQMSDSAFTSADVLT